MADEIVNLTKELGDFKERLAKELGKVNSNIGTLNVKVENLTEISKKQNGHVEDLCVRMTQVEQHPFNCILKEKFELMEVAMKTGDHIGSVKLSQRLDKVERISDRTDRDISELEEHDHAAEKWKHEFWIPIARKGTMVLLVIAAIIVGMHLEEILAKLGG